MILLRECVGLLQTNIRMLTIIRSLFMRMLLPALRSAGYEISYIGSMEGIEKKLIEAQGIPYYGIASGKLRRYFDVKNFTDPFRVLKGFGQASRLMKTLKPDVVFSHEYSPTSIQIALYRQLKLCKYRYYLTTSDNLKMAEDSSGFKAKARNYVLNHADGIIVYSEAVKKWYTDHFPKLKIDICPNIQNPSTLLSYREKFGDIITKYKQQFGLYSGNIILYTGRLVTVKGLDLLLTAFSKIDREDYKLVIVGDGYEKNILKELTRKLKIEQKVIFAGYYSGVELYAWYDLANFFILPSRYEPFGAVVNEALVYGCPVIASKYIGALDFINNSNGKIFDPLNEKEFIETLHDAMNKYAGAIEKRTNLMPCSFDKYVKSFYSI